MQYTFSFLDTVKRLLGTPWRKPRRVAWLTACLKPLSDLHDEFVSFHDEKKYELKWNGQTIKLEKLLIDQFGPGITIENHVVELDGAFVGEGNDSSFFIGEGNDNSQFVDVSYSFEGPNFTVNVPSDITFEQSEMEALINKYKLFGTTYEIVII